MVKRREVADRVGGTGVAGERKGLAAAAAEVEFAPLAAFPRLEQIVELLRMTPSGGGWLGWSEFR
jgi:hypothetical protein